MLDARFTPRERALVVVEALTVGLPFCVFKAIYGLRLLESAVRPLGWLLVVLGAVDAAMNGLNALSVAVAGRRWAPICSLQMLAKLFQPSRRDGELGTALDAALSFSLVAIVIGTGALASLAPALLRSWNIAVILNVLGAATLRFVQALTPVRLSSGLARPGEPVD